uniref:Uncharacterized protein n=1 Tax=Oryza nivara TaxID=4536 RepID=A0A0E0G5R2_ORYNI
MARLRPCHLPRSITPASSLSLATALALRPLSQEATKPASTTMGQYSNIGTKDYTSKLSAIGNVMLHCEPSSYYPLMGWRYRIEMIAKNIQG